jgi:hypothetical protein
MSAQTLQAAQASLAAEHAAVYGYGVVGGRVSDGRRAEATAAYHAHRARRDALVRTVQDLGGEPVAADSAYALPFAVPDSAAAVKLAALLEDRIADVYSDLVRAAGGPLRREAADALREAAVRAVRGLAERSADGTTGTRRPTGTDATAGTTAKAGAGPTH